jgi:CRP/FNR family transcriptional regulator, cyclic AMP receptor protein
MEAGTAAPVLTLWHLADRWGNLTPAGIVLALSHDLLEQLTAARRSTATVALTALEHAETVKRLPDGSWF